MNDSDFCCCVDVVRRIQRGTDGGRWPECAVGWSRVCSPVLHNAERTAGLFAPVCVMLDCVIEKEQCLVIFLVETEFPIKAKFHYASCLGACSEVV